MAQSGVLQASRIQLIRGLVRTMTMPTSPPGRPSLPQVSSTVGRLFRRGTYTNPHKRWRLYAASVTGAALRLGYAPLGAAPPVPMEDASSIFHGGPAVRALSRLQRLQVRTYADGYYAWLITG
jgi:hypothetical protein